MLILTVYIQPEFYYQAIQHSNWREAMATKIEALEFNNTWTITSLPLGKQSIGYKWMYIRSNIELMALLRITKHAWLLKVTPNIKV